MEDSASHKAGAKKSLFHGVLFSHKKEWNSDTCYNVDETWAHGAQWNKSDTKTTNTLGFHF